MSLETSFGYAEEEVQQGADRGGAAPDRSVDVAGQGSTVCCREAGISQRSYYCCRKEGGGLEFDQAKRIAESYRRWLMLAGGSDLIAFSRSGALGLNVIRKSRQCAPERGTHKQPFTNRRLSDPVRPGSLALPGSNLRWR